MKAVHVWLGCSALALFGLVHCNDDELNTISPGPTAQEGAGGNSGSSAGGNAGNSGQAGQAGMCTGSDCPGKDSLVIPGTSMPVEVKVDAAGFLHVYAKNDVDGMRTVGYFHAKNRMFFMEFVRSFVRGRLAEIVKAGSLVLERDFANRLFFSNAQGVPLEEVFWNQASKEAQQLMIAYTEGVNAWLADWKADKNGATLTTEYEFSLFNKDGIRAWEPQDSVAIALYMMNELSNVSSTEILYGKAFAGLPAPLVTDLFAAQPGFPAYTVPAATGSMIPPSPVPDLGNPESKKSFEFNIQAMTVWRPMIEKAWTEQPPPLDPFAGGIQQMMGSNNWVLGPSRTTNKQALLANDPHLNLANPAIWYPVELDSKTGGNGTLHFAGASLPGLPVILSGHNEDIAWGVTTIYYDMADVYMETLTPDGKGVMFNGQVVPIVEKELSFLDSSTGNTVKKVLRWVPHHGPIVSEDLPNQTATSIRWVAHEGSTDMDAVFGLNRATSVNEAKTSLKMLSCTNQNFVVADKKGDIGWFPFSHVPARPWASMQLPPWLPLPGDGTAEWNGFVAVDDLPQLVNPANAAIATANNDLTGAFDDGDPTNDGYAFLQSPSLAIGARQQRILDQIAAGGNNHTSETMANLQGDTYSLVASKLVPQWLSVLNTTTMSPEVSKLHNILSSWKFTCPTGLATSDPKGEVSTDPTEKSESIGCSVFHIALYSLIDQAIGDEHKSANVEVLIKNATRLMMRAFTQPNSLSSSAFWDNVETPSVVETQTDVLVTAMQKASEVLNTVSSDANAWQWGKIHTLQLRSIYDSFGIGTYNEGPYATAGGLFTVNVANPAGKKADQSQRAGASMRTVIELTGTGPKMKFQLPGGSDLHRESPFYNNLMAGWLKNQGTEFAFGINAVSNPSQSFHIPASTP
jgi:penicillin G amidase